MKAGTILSILGEGEYSVSVHFDGEDSIQKRIDALTALIIEVEAQIVAQYFVVQEHEAEVQTHRDDQSYWIGVFNSYPIGSAESGQANKNIGIATGSGLIAIGFLAIEEGKYAALKADRTAKAIEKNRLIDEKLVIVDATVDCWCVDLADGTDGRGEYTVGEETELWPICYDAGNEQGGTFVLPPKNLTDGPNGAGGNLTTLELMPDGHINMPKSYVSLSAACMSFWNTALEPGFCRWAPRVVSGTVEGMGCNVLEDTTNTIEVNLSGSNRLYTTSESYQFRGLASIQYFVGKAAFQQGDKIVCSVPPTEDGVPTVIGFLSNPKGSRGTTSHIFQMANSGLVWGIARVPRTYTYTSSYLYRGITGGPRSYHDVFVGSNDSQSDDETSSESYTSSKVWGSDTISTKSWSIHTKSDISNFTSAVVVDGPYTWTQSIDQKNIYHYEISVNGELSYAFTMTQVSSIRYDRATASSEGPYTKYAHSLTEYKETLVSFDVGLPSVGWYRLIYTKRFYEGSQTLNDGDVPDANAITSQLLETWQRDIPPEGECDELLLDSVQTDNTGLDTTLDWFVSDGTEWGKGNARDYRDPPDPAWEGWNGTEDKETLVEVPGLRVPDEL